MGLSTSNQYLVLCNLTEYESCDFFTTIVNGESSSESWILAKQGYSIERVAHIW